MIWIALAIVLAALIVADKPRQRGGYQPRPLRKGETLGSPPTGGSAVMRVGFNPPTTRATPAQPRDDDD